MSLFKDFDEIMKFIKQNSLEKIKEYINEHKSVNIHIFNEGYVKYSAEYGNLDIVKYFVDLGLNFHANNEAALINAVTKNHLSVVKYLVEKGSVEDIHVLKEEPLFLAIKFGYVDITKYLIEKGANIDEALYWATQYTPLDVEDRRFTNHFDIIEYLLEKGAKYDLNKLDKNQKEIIQLVLDLHEFKKISNSELTLNYTINDLSKIIISYI